MADDAQLSPSTPRLRVIWPFAAALFPILLLGGPARPADEPASAGEETLTEEVLTQRVILPFRVWDTARRRYVTDPAQVVPGALVIHERRSTGEEPRRREAEEGDLQAARTVDLQERPLSLALVVDTSASMLSMLPTLRIAAADLIDGLESDDRVALVAFNDLPTVEAGLRAGRDDVLVALEALSARGSTALHDAVHMGFDVLRRERDPRAIVILTDGVDNASRRSLEVVLDEAYRLGIPLFCIFHRVDYRELGDLARAALDTGGQYLQTSTGRELAEAFAIIAEGLRSRFLLSYASTNDDFDGAWREVEVSAVHETWRIRTSKRGYRALTPAEAAARQALDEPGAADATGPLPIPGPPEGELFGAVPDGLCAGDPDGRASGWCGEGMRAAASPGPPPVLDIRGWVDVAHERELLVHPTRYADGVPDDPRGMTLRYWGDRRGLGRLDPLRLPLADPDHLPHHLVELMEDLLRRGGVLRSLTTSDAQEKGAFRPVVLEVVVPHVPGMTGGAAVRPAGGPSDPRTLDWVDGDVGLAARDVLSRWAFLGSPAYQAWLRDRYEEETEALVARELALLRRHASKRLTGDAWDQLAARLEQRLRAERREAWEPIASGREGEGRRLLARGRDVEATELLAMAESVLIDEMLAANPDPEHLESAWIVPARVAWERLRTFLTPTAHRSLMLLRPVHDRVRGEIWLPRVVLSRFDMSRRRRLTVELPAARPEAMELIAGLLRDPESRGPLAEGYECAEGGVEVWTARHRNWVAHGEEWAGEMSAQEAQRAEAGRAIADRYRSPDPARRAMARLREEAARDRDDRLAPRVFVVLTRTDAPGLGLALFRKGSAPLLARPLDDPGADFVLDPSGPFPGLERLVPRVDVALDAPLMVNARLAARLNGWSDEALDHVLAFARQRGWSSVKLSLDPAPGQPAARVVGDDTIRTLELNLVAAPASRASRALEGLAGP